MTGPASADAPPGPDRDAVEAALAADDVAALLHAGRSDDPDLRYLLGAPPPDAPCAVVVGDDAVVFAAPTDAPGLGVDGTVRRVEHVGSAVAEHLAERATDGRVLAPRHLPHDVALRVERAGVDLASTTVLRRARARKTAAERERLTAVADAARAGVERARERLAAEGGRVDAAELCRTVGGALGEAGASLGATAVRPSAGGVGPGTPVVVTAAPRGPAGYRATLTRTAVVDGEGGWERRAHVGVESARRAALDAVEPGTTVDRVNEAVVGELSAFGLAPPPATRLVHGVGLSRHEAPLPGDGTALEPGHALVVAPAAGGPEEASGTVALADTVLVTEDGHELLTDAPTGLSA